MSEKPTIPSVARLFVIMGPLVLGACASVDYRPDFNLQPGETIKPGEVVKEKASGPYLVAIDVTTDHIRCDATLSLFRQSVRQLLVTRKIRWDGQQLSRVTAAGAAMEEIAFTPAKRTVTFDGSASSAAYPGIKSAYEVLQEVCGSTAKGERSSQLDEILQKFEKEFVPSLLARHVSAVLRSSVVFTAGR